MLQLMREGCSYTYAPLSIARYSFIQLSELQQCRVKKLAQGFNTTAQDSNPGSQESEAHCALQKQNLPLLVATSESLGAGEVLEGEVWGDHPAVDPPQPWQSGP